MTSTQRSEPQPVVIETRRLLHGRPTTAGETRSYGPGYVLLVEDTTGPGHSSTTGDGFTALLISLEWHA